MKRWKKGLHGFHTSGVTALTRTNQKHGRVGGYVTGQFCFSGKSADFSRSIVNFLKRKAEAERRETNCYVVPNHQSGFVCLPVGCLLAYNSRSMAAFCKARPAQGPLRSPRWRQPDLISYNSRVLLYQDCLKISFSYRRKDDNRRLRVEIAIRAIGSEFTIAWQSHLRAKMAIHGSASELNRIKIKTCEWK